MKKILSLLLVGVMMFSMIPAAYATTDHENGTDVIIRGELTDENGNHSEEYTVTVPAELTLGQIGYVVCRGYFPSNRSLIVNASDSVSLTNSLGSGDVTVAVTMNQIAVDGDNLYEVGNGTDNDGKGEPIQVEPPENGAFLFGVWSGHITYEANIVDAG